MIDFRIDRVIETTLGVCTYSSADPYPIFLLQKKYITELCLYYQFLKFRIPLLLSGFNGCGESIFGKVRNSMSLAKAA